MDSQSAWQSYQHYKQEYLDLKRQLQAQQGGDTFTVGGPGWLDHYLTRARQVQMKLTGAHPVMTGSGAVFALWKQARLPWHELGDLGTPEAKYHTGVGLDLDFIYVVPHDGKEYLSPMGLIRVKHDPKENNSSTRTVIHKQVELTVAEMKLLHNNPTAGTSGQISMTYERSEETPATAPGSPEKVDVTDTLTKTGLKVVQEGDLSILHPQPLLASYQENDREQDGWKVRALNQLVKLPDSTWSEVKMVGIPRIEPLSPESRRHLADEEAKVDDEGMIDEEDDAEFRIRRPLRRQGRGLNLEALLDEAESAPAPPVPRTLPPTNRKLSFLGGGYLDSSASSEASTSEAISWPDSSISEGELPPRHSSEITHPANWGA